ncbi:MAG TPA: SHOCT domain-containing protein [Burkholderiaceae bacterium]|nr:SHOCT domain-containing protein [Burkholderiaceae bacterium]
MFSFRLRSSSAALLIVICGSVHAQSDPGVPRGGQPVQIAKDSAVGNVVAKVYDGRAAYVRIETRERNAPLNQHPVAIEPTALRALLTRVQLPDSGNEPLFDAAELDEIVAPLTLALARVLPEQDVSFAVSGQHGMLGALIPRSATTVRVFFAEGRMNLIFGLVRQDWESRFRATGYVIPFEPGKRGSVVDRNVRVAATGGAVARRADWVVLDPLAPPVVASPAESTPTPAVVIPSAAVVPSPAPAATPTAPAAPAAPSAPAPADSDAIYRQVAERLKALQKLRDTGVITEEEYQQKRREILKAL